MTETTTEKGNRFRDMVAAMLEAAGFRATSEVREDFKKVDVIWERDGIDGKKRYAVECKDYDGNLPKQECINFKAEYGTFIENKTADYAWLISRGDISPDGRELIDKSRDLTCFTFAEFQRRLLGLDKYISSLVDAYDASGSERWYVPLKSEEGEDLEKIVRDWLTKEDAFPLAFIAGYGKGKSTFASRLSAVLARECQKDASLRVPILIPLGDIMDEQSLEGLLGKSFVSQSTMYGYNFGLFDRLNQAGRFVILFDGFDEMKHGMTMSKFDGMVRELLRLDKGRAKIIILGRDTAFQDQHEFRSIIEGRQRTSGGAEIQTPDRRQFQRISIKDFSLDEAKSFVSRYFPALAREGLRGSTGSDAWIDGRLQEITSSEFDSLLTRPVHARMLCQVATNPETSLRGLSKYGLFDRFLHYLLDREVRKTGRDSRFNVEVRRKINASVAYWLWRHGAASTVSLSEIPMELCHQAAVDVDHDYDDLALRRELTQGCLLDKGSNTVFFGHRSLQEFLVAEAMVRASIDRNFDRQAFKECVHNLNPEIRTFLLEGAREDNRFRDALAAWVACLGDYSDRSFPKIAMELLFTLTKEKVLRLPPSAESPWYGIIQFFVANGSVQYSIKELEGWTVLQTLLREMHGLSVAHQAAIMFLFSAVFTYSDRPDECIAAWTPRHLIANALSSLRSKGRNSRLLLRYEDNLPLWLYALSCHPVAEDDGSRARLMDIDLSNLRRHVTSVCDIRVDMSLSTASLAKVRVPLNAIYRHLGVKDNEIEAVRPFFIDEAIVERLSPILKNERPQEKPAIVAETKPTRRKITLPSRK